MEKTVKVEEVPAEGLRRVIRMETPGERPLLMLAYMRDHPGCRPRDLALSSGSYGAWNAAGPRQRRVLCLAAGSMCGLMAKAGLVRREGNATRFWITENGLSALTDAADRQKRTCEC